MLRGEQHRRLSWLTFLLRADSSPGLIALALCLSLVLSLSQAQPLPSSEVAALQVRQSANFLILVLVLSLLLIPPIFCSNLRLQFFFRPSPSNETSNLSQSLCLSFNFKPSGWDCANATSTSICGVWAGLVCANGTVTAFSTGTFISSAGIPAEIAGLSNLTRLELSAPALPAAAPLPTAFIQLTQLRVLRVDSPGVLGAIPAFLTALVNLNTLSLEGDKLTGSTSPLTALANLTYLSLSAQKDLDQDLLVLLLPNLVEFRCFGCTFTGQPLPSFGPSLEVADLSYCRFPSTTTIPADYFSSRPVPFRSLNLAWDSLRGGLPQDTTKWPIRLDVSGNRYFNATVPRNLLDPVLGVVAFSNIATDVATPSPWPDLSIPSGSPLVDLSLFSSGTIPVDISRLDRLTQLRVDGGSGPLPLGLISLTALKNLIITNGQNNGTLSGLLGNLASLEILDLHNNGFDGILPLGLSRLANLTRLDFSGNNFGPSCWFYPEPASPPRLFTCSVGSTPLCCDSPIAFPFFDAKNCTECAVACTGSCNGGQPGPGFTCVDKRWTSATGVVVSSNTSSHPSSSIS